MRFRRGCLVLGLLLLVHCSFQQFAPKKKPVKKGTADKPDQAIELLQKQIDDIVQELNLLKEKQALQTVCLKGVKIHGKCFLADPVRKRYHAANEDCISLGGVLSSPMSAAENDQLGDYVRQSMGPDGQVWLGINDMVTEGEWKDQIGLSLLYKNWDSRQPNGERSENCAVLSGNNGGKWSDENCREEKASVCEFNIA